MNDLSINTGMQEQLHQSAREFLDALDARDAAKHSWELVKGSTSFSTQADAAMALMEAEGKLKYLREIHKPYRRELDPDYLFPAKSAGRIEPQEESGLPELVPGYRDEGVSYRGVWTEEEYHDNRERLRSVK